MLFCSTASEKIEVSPYCLDTCNLFFEVLQNKDILEQPIGIFE
jgi:hypothetical protein